MLQFLWLLPILICLPVLIRGIYTNHLRDMKYKRIYKELQILKIRIKTK